MKKIAFPFVLSLFVFAGLLSCSDDKSDDPARVQLHLVDAEGDYEQVNVEIIDIQYNSSEDEDGWTSMEPQGGYPIHTDLTKLIAGNSLLLSDELIPAGTMKQIRLVLSDNNTLLLEGDAELIHLETPSAEQSGLKIQLDTELEPGFSYTFILDWDVQRSVVKAGNSGQYILKPVINAIAEVNSGSLSGNVTGDLLDDMVAEAVPLPGVTVNLHTLDEQYVASTLTDAEGKFLFQGLEPGQYRIKMEELEFVPYVSPQPLEISAGMVTDAGTIELLVPVN